MHPDIATLVREQRLTEAAELASTRGDHRDASALWERACEFSRAADAALRAGDAARAMTLAVQGDDEAIAQRALDGLRCDAAAAERVALALERRGDHLWAARILEAVEQPTAAAHAYERAGFPVEAARLLEARGEIVSAARMLEAHSRRNPTNHGLHVALGALLLRHGKVEAAVRTLQRVPEGTTEHRAAVTWLIKGFESLGWLEARIQAEQQLARVGGPVDTQLDTPPRDSALPSRGSATVGADPLRGAVRLFGRYEWMRDVASSPSARVLECLDVVRGERVALKIFAGYEMRGGGRDALARFEREVRVLGSLDHPNIVPLRDYLPEGPALALGWMVGGTLEQRLRIDRFAPARAVEIAEGVLAALGEAHRLGVTHRDIKPANVLFDEAGVTRLSDFGVAHLNDVTTTATASVIGTLGYMSPEQREGRPASVRSDIYGVGAVLWEMLTGERPPGPTEEGKTRRPPSGVHRNLDARHDDVVLSFLSGDPENRPNDAFAARRVLSDLPWPHALERFSSSVVPTGASVPPAAPRLLRDSDGTATDTWLGRSVETLVLDTTTLSRASAFARADHPALQTILRVDRVDQTIWLSIPRGKPIEAKLTAVQASTLRAALGRLHAQRTVHGQVDRAHVWEDEAGGVILAFSPTPGPHATAELDFVALACLF